MSDLTTKDLDYEKNTENYSKVEELEKKINEFEKKIVNLENNNYIEKSQTESVEPKKIENNESKEEVKESKLDISKFIEAFSQEFDFINKEQFNEEMENDEIMNKIIELIKRMLGIKNDKIEEQKKEYTNTLEEKIKEIEDLKEEKKKKEKEIEDLKEEKKKKEKEIDDLKEEKEKKEEEIDKLKKEKEKKEKEIDDLKEEKEKKEEEIDKLKKEKEKKEEEIDKLKKEKEKNAENIKKFMGEYENKKKELESIGDLLEARKLYDKYLSMETRILSKLDNVLIQRDFESFISSGYTLSSLDNVWDIVKIEYKNISNEDIETLKEVFSFFLSQINKRFKEAKYSLVEVEVGEDFDPVNQVDLSQNSRGKVTEYVFYGYGFLKEKEVSNEEDVITRIIKMPLVLTV